MRSIAATTGPMPWTGISSFLDRAFIWSMSVFIFVTVFLPGGSIYGVNFKAPLYLVLLPLAVYRMFRRGLATPARLALACGVPAILSTWVVIGIAYGFAGAGSLRHYADVVMTSLLCWLAFVFSAEEYGGRIRFLRLVLIAEVTTSVFKAGLIAYAVLRGIPTVELVATLSTIFGVNLMTMDLGAMFGRVQFISDALIPVCIYLVLRYRNQIRIGNIRASLTILLLITSVVFSFSRYLWTFSALAFFLGLILGKRDRFQLTLTLLLGASVFVTLPFVGSLYTLRFSSEVAGSSDLARSEQHLALRTFFQDAPLLGHGFGSYTNAVIREDLGNTTMNYGYEEQLLALCGQLGLLGIATLAALGLYYYSDLWWRSGLWTRDRLGISMMLIAWLSAGLYNPLLFHPIAGINYAVFAAMAGLRNRGQPPQQGRLSTSALQAEDQYF